MVFVLPLVGQGSNPCVALLVMLTRKPFNYETTHNSCTVLLTKKNKKKKQMRKTWFYPIKILDKSFILIE